MKRVLDLQDKEGGVSTVQCMASFDSEKSYCKPEKEGFEFVIETCNSSISHQSLNRRFDLGPASGRFDLISIEIVDISTSFCMFLSIFPSKRDMYGNIQHAARLRPALPEPCRIRIFLYVAFAIFANSTGLPAQT